jgi:polyferredoxin
MFGRLWCGWLCPQSVLVDISEDIAHPRKRRLLHIAGALVLSLAVGAATVCYFVPAGEFIARLLAFGLSPVEGWAWAVISTVVLLDIVLLGRRFCTAVCPYAKLQGALYDNSTMLIGFDPSRAEECMGCEACVRACPVGIDIREGLQSECVNCAECLDACSRMLSRKGKPAIVGYHFGRPGGRLSFLRPAPLIFGAAGLLMAGLLVFQIAGRQDIEITALPNYDYGLRVMGDGRAAASFVLVIENRGSSDIGCMLEADRGGIALAPPSIYVLAGERRKLAVLALFNTSVAEPGAFELFILSTEGRIIARSRVGIIPGGR